MLMTKETRFYVVNGVDKPPIHDSYDLWHFKTKKILRKKKNYPRPSNLDMEPSTIDTRQKDRLLVLIAHGEIPLGLARVNE